MSVTPDPSPADVRPPRVVVQLLWVLRLFLSSCSWAALARTLSVGVSVVAVVIPDAMIVDRRELRTDRDAEES